ncbi:MAG: hypothetical protein HZC41_21715 [Chloroflexi bacterium]|nr:hypothetical protein [Chloroflexota bacterium]
MSKRRRKSVGTRHAVPLQPDADQPPDIMPIWECPNCGQNYFGAQPPDMCAYCRDFTTWRPVQPDDPHNLPDKHNGRL